MQDNQNVLPSVMNFIRSFPKRKKYTRDDIDHYPEKMKYHCSGCSREMDVYLMGIAITSGEPQNDHRKWVVTYDCDLCKNLVSFKYCTPDEELTFIRGKNPF